MDDQHLGPAALIYAARTIGQASTTEETLRTIAETALAAIPGIDHVGLSVLSRSGKPITEAATSDLVVQLDDLQCELGEGPCLESLEQGSVVTAPQIGDDPRWPRYTSAAAKLGLKAQLAVTLCLDDQDPVGGLNMYSTRSEDIDPNAPVMAELFAAQAALALSKVREVEQLQQALRNRQVISQAVGILMATHNLDADDAFDLLRRTSRRASTSVRDISARIIEDRVAKVSKSNPST